MRRWPIVLLVLAAACANPDQARINATSRGRYDPLNGKLIELTYDRNKHGKIDTWIKMDGKRPVCARIDTNDDGIVDRWEYYGDHGELVRAGWARAAPPPNGAAPVVEPAAPSVSSAPPAEPADPCAATAASLLKPDAWAYMGPDGKTARIEYLEVSAITGQEVVVRREFYEHDKIVRAEEDSFGDGVIDQWETYIDGKRHTVELDDGHDGVPDRRLTYDTSGALVLIESAPDGKGGYLKKTLVK